MYGDILRCQLPLSEGMNISMPFNVMEAESNDLKPSMELVSGACCPSDYITFLIIVQKPADTSVEQALILNSQANCAVYAFIERRYR